MNLPVTTQEPQRRVLQRTTPEQRHSLYDDVRELLLPGFLSESIVINGTRMAMRSLVRSDFHLLQYRAGSTDLRQPEVQWWLMASALWMIDGQPLLCSEGIVDVCRFVEKLPTMALTEMYYVLNRLQQRAEKAIDRIRGFNFETESRHLWLSYGESINAKSGVPGAEALGLNAIQRMWIAFNKAEDERDAFQTSWLQTKLIAATQSPKGMKKLNHSDQQANDREKARRQAIMDAVYAEAHGEKIDIQAVSKRGRFNGIKAALTPEELEDEFQRWKAGVKDDHDLVVDAYKARIANQIERERTEQRARVEAAQRAAEAEGFTEPSLRPLVMDAQEIRQRFGGRTKVFYGTKANSLYERYIAHEAQPGTIVMRNGQPQAVPESESKPLDDQVRQRMLRQRGGR